VPIASTAWAAIVQPNTEMMEPGTVTTVVPSTETAVVLCTGMVVVPYTGMAVVPSTGMVGSTAESQLDSENKATTERTYMQTNRCKYGCLKHSFMTCAQKIENIFYTVHT